ncbi:MAG TPA: aspartate carbamoyltransferase [bacterium]|nr:aspartate carbamoyltransferase [bacterium]HQI03872.1 aspartate carbamoyltransferase [bacterium]HQN72321.1 aspartate carbamoyltransferase [bacterium]
MNYLDQQFENFKNLPIEKKIELFEMDGKLFDMIISQQLSREVLETLYNLTNHLRRMGKLKEGLDFLATLLSHKRAMLYFEQPSSRTFLSFLNACHILGLKTSEIRDTSVSSEVKGESYFDSIRTFSSYTDLVIMRSKNKDAAEKAAWLLNTYSNRPVPIINGGSGADQHPTQALLDIYTLMRSFANQGGLDGKTVMFCGDLRRGRTARSLAYLLERFNDVKLIFCAPKEFQILDDILESLDRKGVKYEIITESVRSGLDRADAIYMTRIQDEHDLVAGESSTIDISKFKLSGEDLKYMKPGAAILHPFPRRDEISTEIDSDPRAKYWRQGRNGMWTRVALIAYVFNLEKQIMEFDVSKVDHLR